MSARPAASRTTTTSSSRAAASSSGSCIHLPALALTRSVIERLLLLLCERFGLPTPHVNVHIGDWLVDAVSPHAKVVVEVDGTGHRTEAQVERDHQRDLELRALGYIVLRYTEAQIRDAPAAVAADIRRYL
jgi:very-short-patch-repair endonuclease